MAKPWKDVEQSEGFKSLPDDKKDEAKRQYFDQVVSPQVPEQDRETAWSQFSSFAGVGRRSLPSGTMESTAGAGRGFINPPMASEVTRQKAVDQVRNRASAPTVGNPMALSGAEIFDDGEENIGFGKDALPARGSVLERTDMPEPKFNATEAARLSSRAYTDQQQREALSRQSVRPSNPQKPTLTGQVASNLEDAPFPARVIGKAALGAAEGGAGLVRAAGELTGLDSVAEIAKGSAQAARSGQEAIGEVQSAEGFGPRSPVPYLGRMAEGAAQSLGASVATGLAFGSGAVIPSMFAGSAGRAYDEGRNAGLDPSAALARASSYGAFEVAGEKFQGLDKAVGALGTLMTKGASTQAKRDASAELIRAGVREVPGELLTYFGQTGTDLMPGIGINPNLTIGQFLDGMRDTVVQSSMMGGALGVAGAASRNAGKNRPVTAAEIAKSKGFLLEPTPEESGRLKSLQDAGEKSAAAIMQSRIDKRVAADSMGAEAEAMAANNPALATPNFQDQYKSLRVTGIKPVEAAARASVLSSFGQAAQAANLSPEATQAAIQAAQAKDIADLPGFLSRYSEKLAEKGIGQAIPPDFLESARDDAMETAMQSVYAPPAAADILAMEQDSEPASTVTPEQEKKAKWLKAINDQNRMQPDGGVQLTVTPDGKLNFMGNPGATKQGRALEATLQEAFNAGATAEEIAASINSAKIKKPSTAAPQAQEIPQNPAQPGVEPAQNAIETVATPLEEVANQAATSPQNDLPEPTEAQKKAGNYKVGRAVVSGMQISFENPAGSTRKGVGADGKAWETPMKSHYGYFRGTTAADGDKLDVFVKPGTAQDFDGQVFVVDQVDPKTGAFDEHKVILGASSQAEAEQIYRENYEPGWNGLGAISGLPMPAFKTWAASRHTKKPLAFKEQASQPKGLRIGSTPKLAEPVTVRDGVIYIGSDPAINYETGDFVQAVAGATSNQIIQALRDAGALSRRQKIYGNEQNQEAGTPTGQIPSPAPDQEIAPMAGNAAGRPIEPAAAASAPVESDGVTRDPASWVIKEKATGNVIMETFDKKKVDALNTAKYEAVPITDHLVGLNKEIKDKKVTRLGINNIDIAEGGKPFKTQREAKKAQKAQPMMRVLKAPGGKGFILADKTPAQLAAEAERARDMALPSVGEKGKPMAAHEFIASEGGLNQDADANIGFGRNPKIGNRWLYAKKGSGKGLTLSQAAEKLWQNGYSTEELSESQVAEMMKRSFDKPTYTAEGFERIAQAETETRFEDYMAAQAEAQDTEFDPFPLPDGYTSDIREESGYDEATVNEIRELEALIAQAEAEGIDTDSIRERFAQQENLTREQYRAAVRAEVANQRAVRGNSTDSDRREDSEQGRQDAIGESRPDRGQDDRPESAQGNEPRSITKRSDGTLSVKGNAQAIRETLTQAGIPAQSIMPMDGGVLVGRTQADNAKAALQPAPRLTDADAVNGGLSILNEQAERLYSQPAGSWVLLRDGGTGNYNVAYSLGGRYGSGDSQKTAKAAYNSALESWTERYAQPASMFKQLDKSLFDSGEQDSLLTQPTREDILSQQDRAENAQALDDKAQIDREASGFTLQSQTQDIRKDNTGDMFGGPSVADFQAAAQRKPAGTANTGPDLFAQPATSPLVQAMNDLAEVRQRIADQGQVVDDRLLSRERQLKALVKELESEGQNDELDAEMQSYEAKADQKQALSEREKAAKAKMFNALGKLATLAGKNTRMNWTAEEEQQLLPIVIELFDGAVELGSVTFQQAVAYVRDFITANLDKETADAIPFETLQGAYIAMSGRHKDKEVTSKKEVVGFDSLDDLKIEKSTSKADAKEQPMSLAQSLYRAISNGDMPKDNAALKKLVEAFDGKPAEPSRMKEAQEQLETAIVMAARDVVSKNEGDNSTYQILTRLYESQPNLNIRTSTSIANQAYSTPAPLAFLASRLAGITSATTVLEPTAGNGMLLIGAKVGNTSTNEINDDRVAALKAQGFKPTQKDAAEGFPGAAGFDAVITNPPFGSVKDKDGGPTKVKVDGFNVGQIDHLIAARALAAMKDDGKAVLILGANKVAGGLSTDDRIFFNWLYSNYNVAGHFEVDGDLYTRQGASWPVRVIAINGRYKSNSFSPIAGTVKRVQNWKEVYEQYQIVLDASRQPIPSPGASLVGDGRGQAGSGSVSSIANSQNSEARKPSTRRSKIGAGNVAGTSAGALSNSAEPSPKPVGGSADEQRLNAQPSGKDRLEPTGGIDAGASRNKPAKPAGATALRGKNAGNQFQAPYIPRSARKDEGVLIPTNMAQPTQDALSALEDEVGDIDEFARKELAYKTVDDLHDALMGLQVDSVATAIYQIKKDKATVIADQTGIGKGRQAASIIRWAAKNGYTPVFMSVKPSLFTDMYGDLADIGTTDVNPFIMNGDAWVAGEGGAKLFANKPGTHKRSIEAIASSGQLPAGSNALFMTYSQINTDNVQRRALMALAPRAVFVLDESHNAAGASATGEFVISALGLAKGVTYLSATYAKRPDNMALYFKTDIGDAAADTDGLSQAMAAGGLPLQTVVSNNLVKAGQMFRRERSYDGVQIASVFDTANRAKHERLSDEATKALRAIVAADKAFHSGYVKNLAKELEEQGESLKDMAGNQASAGVQHTEFSSVVHNFVKQMLLGLKAQSAADEAIASLKRDEKPIIAVENTMGSFLAEYATSNGINQGDYLGSFDYRTVLSRALERSRVIVVKDAQGNETKEKIPLSRLDFKTLKYYEDAQEVIDGLKLDIPVSPIDWMRSQIIKAGYQVAEITGRNLSVDYSDPKKPILSAIDQLEQSDKVNTTRRFNSGKLDALILNVAGSTGISLHASEKFEDQRQRHMIVAQAAGDINIFMQMLGRIHRTGQVALPKYTILSVDLPTEKRPTAVLSVKMKSLNANTSSNTESATSVKTSDILNKYGDQVVQEYLSENYQLAVALDVQDLVGGDGIEDDLARKVTGRLALQPIEVQHSFYDEVEGAYNALIDFLNKTNQNDLEPRTFDFDAKETRQEVLFEGPNKSTPFGEDAIYGEYSIKAQGSAMKPEEIRDAMKTSLGEKTPAAHANEMVQSLLNVWAEQINKDRQKNGLVPGAFDEDKYSSFIAGVYGKDSVGFFVDAAKASIASGKDVADITASALSNTQDAHAGIDFIRSHPIGSKFRVDINSESYNAIVTNIRSTHKQTGNPFSFSKIQLTVSVNGALRSLSIPASQFRKIEVSRISDGFQVDQLFKEQPQNQRETAKIVTGNLLAAYGEIEGVRGTIISFTKQDGTTEQGILLPKLFNYSKNTRGDFRLPDGKSALRFLQTSDNRDIGRFGITSRDGNVRVLPSGQGIRVQVPKSKAKGGKFFLDKALIEAGGDFVSSGNYMVSTVYDPKPAVNMLDLLMKKQALYALPSMAEEAKQISKESGGSDGSNILATVSNLPTSTAPAFYSALSRHMDGLNVKALPVGAWKDAIKGAINQGKIKEDEVEWTGIREWLGLQEGKVTKEQVTAYLDANGVQVEEVTLGSGASRRDLTAERNGEGAWRVVSEGGEVLLDNVSQSRADEYVDGQWQGESTKYQQYTLPGGENYREVLLTLPTQRVILKNNSVENKIASLPAVVALKEYEKKAQEEHGDNWKAVIGSDWRAMEKYDRLATDAAQAERNLRLTSNKEQVRFDKKYKSSHWDQQNVLAHIRVNDRTDADGKRVLFVEEIQSDFQQDYRKAKQQVKAAVEADFTGIVERMKKAGVLEVNCD